MASRFDRKLVVEGGEEYLGRGFGDTRDSVCELVFNTSMVGYQEIVSDPSCAFLGVVMTYPVIGNYGIADDDFEAKVPSIGALIVREYNDQPSNFRYTKTLSEILEESRVPGISGVDTRKLARSIRDFGNRRALITSADTPLNEALEIIRKTPVRRDAVAAVSCKKRWYSRTSNHRHSVVAVDCGIKLNIVRSLNARGANVTVVPWNTAAEDILAMKPDGVLFSNGPGDPEDVEPVVDLVRALRGHLPMFGIDLGHLLIARAYGAETYKLKFGHHGGNHPVRNLASGKIEITSQGHAHAVDRASLAGTGLQLTHVNLLDDTVEGICCPEDDMFAVQFHPESAPGPQDSAHLFDRFIASMKGGAHNA